MPRDAKLGFAIGLALVILIAVLYYQAGGMGGTAGNVGPYLFGRERANRPVPGVPPTAKAPRRHVVQEGESLSSLAEQYYGDRSLGVFLYHANRDTMRAPDKIAIGMELQIPDQPKPGGG